METPTNKNFRITRLARVFAALLVTAASVSAAGDLTLGTWKLNLAKSKFIPGPPFKSDTRIYEATRTGTKVTISTIEADGRSVTSEFPENFDGKFYPVGGAGGPADAIAMKKINDHVAESTLMHGSVIVASARRVVSEDGKTMTITYKGSDPTGRQVDMVLVYEKQ